MLRRQAATECGVRVLIGTVLEMYPLLLQQRMLRPKGQRIVLPPRARANGASRPLGAVFFASLEHRRSIRRGSLSRFRFPNAQWQFLRNTNGYFPRAVKNMWSHSGGIPAGAEAGHRDWQIGASGGEVYALADQIGLPGLAPALEAVE